MQSIDLETSYNALHSCGKKGSVQVGPAQFTLKYSEIRSPGHRSLLGCCQTSSFTGAPAVCLSLPPRR